MNNKELIERLIKMCTYIQDTYNDDVIEVTIKALQDADKEINRLNAELQESNSNLGYAEKELSEQVDPIELVRYVMQLDDFERITWTSGKILEKFKKES
jgi:RNA processing factor Prp31